MGWYGVYTTIAIVMGAIACLAFCIDYYRLSRGFRRSEFWWLLIGFPASLGALLIFILISRFIPDSVEFWRQLVGAILFTIFIAIVPMKHRLMRRSMTEGRRKARGEQSVRTPKQKA